MATNSSRKRNAAPPTGISSKKPNKETKPVEVFLRLAPYGGSDATLLAVDDDRVRCVAPPGLHQRNGQPYPETEYSFSMVFDERDSQADIFEHTGLDLVEGVVKGQNALLFAYGVTGSGKTYTMTGSAQSVGLLPRVFDVLFNSLDNRTAKCVFAPDGRNGFVVRGESAAVELRRQQEDLDDSTEALPRQAETKRVRGVRHDHASSVFVQYYELYNDVAYDLLENTPEGQMPSKRTLHVDSSNMVFVEGATEVEVDSADEALRVFYHGEERRRKSDTLLNIQSSRSHAVFSIRIAQAPLEGSYPTLDPQRVIVSQLALVDLAGSERAKRTKNVGERLAEAGKINQSLMVLRQCLDKLRRNQQSPGGGETVPYRDSKLTYLFKNYFEGHGQVRMIVCANPRPADFEENLAVMQFAESAQAVQVKSADIARLFGEGEVSVPVPHRFYTKWSQEVDRLLAEVDARSSHHAILTASPQIPNELHEGDVGLDLVTQLREHYEERIMRRNDLRMELARRDAEAMAAVRGVACLCEWRGGELERLEKELEDERADNTRLRANYKHLQRENESLKRRLAVYEQHDAEANAHTEKLRRSRKEMSEQLKSKQRTLQQVADIIEGSPNVAALRSRFDHSVPRGGAGGGMETQRSQRTVVTSSMVNVTSESSATESSSVHRSRAAPGHINPKFDHRRSKSATTRTGRVLDHEPSYVVPEGTVMQPALPRGTQKTSRPDRHQLKKSTDYVLRHQETDEQGNLKTEIIKGECVPTAGGGTAVLFSDVERLTHESPAGNSKRH